MLELIIQLNYQVHVTDWQVMQVAGSNPIGVEILVIQIVTFLHAVRKLVLNQESSHWAWGIILTGLVWMMQNKSVQTKLNKILHNLLFKSFLEVLDLFSRKLFEFRVRIEHSALWWDTSFFHTLVDVASPLQFFCKFVCCHIWSLVKYSVNKERYLNYLSCFQSVYFANNKEIY